MENLTNRIVHFDLKGAPWKVPYLTNVILMAKHWGATGILFEWEDSFPFTGDLINIGSLGGSSRDGLYSRDEILYLLQFTKDNGLEPIQLVQTLAHMEYVLKHEQFAVHRELDYSPFMLCPTRLEGRTLAIAMVKQILEMQPDAKYIHIGADEACHLNQCTNCQAKSSGVEYGTDFLFIDHIQKIILEVKKYYPTVKFLIWDDMMRTMEEKSLIAYCMYQFVIPVVWNYGPVGGFAFDPQMWAKYQRAFLQVWAGSAFKGANGACQIISPVERYVSNQEAWMLEIPKAKAFTIDNKSLAFTGLILTGWSRYDHYATLCELLPVSLPSLASCLKMWTKPPHIQKEAVVSESLPPSEWPGHECASSIRKLYECREQCNSLLNGEHVTTWMNSWQVAHNYTNPMQLRPIAHKAKYLYLELSLIRAEVSGPLLALTGARSADEWLRTFVDATASAVRDLVMTAEARCLLPAGVTPTQMRSNEDNPNS